MLYYHASQFNKFRPRFPQVHGLINTKIDYCCSASNGSVREFNPNDMVPEN